MKDDALERLKAAFRSLPGIGPRSAQRIVSRILARDRDSAKALCQALDDALKSVKRCEICGRLCEGDICSICQDEKRDVTQICVVESDEDLEAIEATRNFNGRYFVLAGLIDPAFGTGAEELDFERLFEIVSQGIVKEVILATPFTPQGDATAHYLARFLKARNATIHVTRLSRGIPAGIELEYTDANTIANAIYARKEEP